MLNSDSNDGSINYNWYISGLIMEVNYRSRMKYPLPIIPNLILDQIN